MNDVFSEIIRQRERKNERVVAYVRFSFNLMSSVGDTLGFFGLIHFTSVPPNGVTLGLDLTLVLAAGAVLFAVTRLPYWRGLKFFSITLDFTFIALLLLFDPSVSQSPVLIPWLALVAALFVYSYNLLRFSAAGTLYAALLAIVLFLVFALRYQVVDFLPMLLGLSMFLVIGYFLTTSNIKMMREANARLLMERFLAPELVSELLSQNVLPSHGGKSQETTILFADIRSFTSISERLPPERVVAFLNAYLSTMTEIIFAHGGTIDKFIGDAIMAFFGAPRRSVADEENAVNAAVAMVKALPQIAEKFPEVGPLKIGVGIHTGDVVVGNIGSEKRLDYTAIGDNVNLASRIEGLTKGYGCSILISDATRQKLGARAQTNYQIREIDLVAVQGKQTSTKIFEVVT